MQQTREHAEEQHETAPFPADKIRLIPLRGFASPEILFRWHETFLLRLP